MTEIQSAAIYRCTDKSGQFVGYLVQSDTHPQVFYKVMWSNEVLAWICDCPNERDSCKHRRAVRDVIQAKRRQKLVEAKPDDGPSQKGHLHGANGFKLLKD